MKRVYLIRHGKPDFPEGESMCIGSTDIPLGETGFVQAEAMAKALPPVAAVFSSPLIRAIQTALAIGKPVTVVDDLRELHMGAWDGLTYRQIRQQFPELYEARGLDPSLPMPGAEAYDDGLARFERAMQAAAEAAPGDFAVVAHGGIFALFLQHISGSWKKPDYCQILPIFWENGIFTLQEEP